MKTMLFAALAALTLAAAAPAFAQNFRQADPYDAVPAHSGQTTVIAPAASAQ